MVKEQSTALSRGAVHPPARPRSPALYRSRDIHSLCHRDGYVWERRCSFFPFWW